jgi:hypothetical protein
VPLSSITDQFLSSVSTNDAQLCVRADAVQRYCASARLNAALGDVRSMMRLSKQVVRYRELGHKLALLAGIPRPPYTRENALIVETVGPSVSISIELISPSIKSKRRLS